MTLRTAVRSLRTQRLFALIKEAIKEVNGARGEHFRIVEYSVQANHIHMIVEAANHVALSRGMQSLMLRLVHRVNKTLHRRGSLFTDRFHDRELTTARAVKAVLAYVFANFRKHSTAEARAGLALDPYSSAIYFDGFSTRAARDQTFSETERPNLRGRSHLLRVGWKREGLLSIDYCPPASHSE